MGTIYNNIWLNIRHCNFFCINIYVEGVSWINNIQQINLILWLTKIEGFLDQALVMVFLLIIGNDRILKNWVIKLPYGISENSEGKRRAVLLYYFCEKWLQLKFLKCFTALLSKMTSTLLYRKEEIQKLIWNVYEGDILYFILKLFVNYIILKITGKLQASCSN